MLARFRALFERHYVEDRDRTLRQGLYAYLVGLLGEGAFYGAYAWVALRTAQGQLSFGEMTLFLLVFRHAQSSIHGVLGETQNNYDNLLYVAELFAFLDLEPTPAVAGTATAGPNPADGLRFEGVTFVYPDAAEPTLRGIDLHVPPATSSPSSAKTARARPRSSSS
jgi:ATP-binding cassette subfamily B protein